METLTTQPQTSSPLTTLYDRVNGLSDSDYSPNQEAPSNSSPKAPHSEKANDSTDSASPRTSKAAKVQAIVESLVGDSNKSQNETNDKINEIDSYINKLLDKLKGERQKIAELESARSSLRSLVASDKERQQEQENVEPVKAAKEVKEPSPKAGSSPNSARSERSAPKEGAKAGEKSKRLALVSIDPFKNQKMSLNEIIGISTTKMNFGVALPGKIVEESLDITNKTNEDIVVQIYVDCMNVEFKDSEEYIYSIRRSHLYDYNDKHYLIMSPYSAASFKITLKVPNMKYENEIKGEVKIGVRGVKGAAKIGLSSVVTVPKVVCPKELYSNELKTNIIKLAIKQGKKQESKFPLKNLSNVPVSLDLNFFTPKNVEEDSQFQVNLQPNVVNIPPNGTVYVNVNLKSLKGKLAHQELKTIKKVLVGTARNSAIMYTYLLVIDVC